MLCYVNVSRSLCCFTISICHGVENYYPRLWGTGISDAIFVNNTIKVDLKLDLGLRITNTYGMEA